MGHIHESHGVHILTWRCNQVGKIVRHTTRDNDTAEDEAEQGHLVFSTKEEQSEEVGVSDFDDGDWSTVFVNAANAPLGGLTGEMAPVQAKWEGGGPGHQPVVVDLRDYPNEHDL